MATKWNLTKQTCVCRYFSFVGPVYANIFANNTLTNNAKTNQFAALYLRRIFLLPYKKVLKLNKICDLGNKKKLNKTNMCLPLFIFFLVPYSQKMSHNSATNNANQICFLHLSESLTIRTFELDWHDLIYNITYIKKKTKLATFFSF